MTRVIDDMLSSRAPAPGAGHRIGRAGRRRHPREPRGRARRRQARLELDDVTVGCSEVSLEVLHSATSSAPPRSIARSERPLEVHITARRDGDSVEGRGQRQRHGHRSGGARARLRSVLPRPQGHRRHRPRPLHRRAPHAGPRRIVPDRSRITLRATRVVIRLPVAAADLVAVRGRAIRVDVADVAAVRLSVPTLRGRGVVPATRTVASEHQGRAGRTEIRAPWLGIPRQLDAVGFGALLLDQYALQDRPAMPPPAAARSSILPGASACANTVDVPCWVRVASVSVHVSAARSSAPSAATHPVAARTRWSGSSHAWREEQGANHGRSRDVALWTVARR